MKRTRGRTTLWIALGLMAATTVMPAAGAEEGKSAGPPEGCCGMCQAGPERPGLSPGPAADAATTKNVSAAPQRLRRHGRMGGRMRGGGMGRAVETAEGTTLTRHGVMREAMALVHTRGSITRSVEEIPGGVRTVTTTSDPAMVHRLRQHPKDMQAYYEAGGSVRHWDPLFVELAKHQDKITMTFKEIENGIEVESTSDDPAVVGLIRAHAAKVNEFVARGHEAVHETTPLPEGYGNGAP